ncbi:LamG domain-containing protein [Carboxylicivirga sp. RSCT41]|uniref:LamG domain-containing protein n=1 Tax=Carboxylicivirga agarovorans TaxID=3417570 RepID=UPI003D3494B7
MNTIKTILYSLGILLSFAACNDGIDDIRPEEPGTDELAPVVTIMSPQDGDQLIVAADSPVPLMLEVVDDIELDKVTISINNEVLETIADFTDYRRYAPLQGHGLKLENGSYTMQIEGTDKTGKSTLSETISFSVVKMGDFEPLYGESFYMSFQNHYLDHASVENAAINGFPGFEENGVVGAAYQGAEGASLSFPVADVFSGREMTAAFWYNIAQQGRSGILSASPSGSNNNRVAGFRLFREGGDDAQTIKLNIGNGSYDQWFDGGAAATINPQTTEWVHVAITISESSAAVYIDGEVVSQGDLGEPISWDNCEDLYIASGGPHFSEWDHKEDLSLYDELRIFQKALSQDEIKAIIANEQ